MSGLFVARRVIRCTVGLCQGETGGVVCLLDDIEARPGS